MRFLILLFALCTFGLQAQELSFSAGYNYLSASEWDKAVRIYNFSRPFLSEKQPLLTHGWELGTTWLPIEKPTVKAGPAVTVANFKSYASNAGTEVGINAWLLHLDFVFRYEWEGKDTSLFWYAQFQGGATFTMLSRTENGEVLEVDESPLTSFGVGPSFGIASGKHLLFLGKKRLGAQLGAVASPFLFTDKSEVVLNQSSTLLSSSTTFFQFSASLFLSL